MFHANHFHNPTKACPIFNLLGAAAEFPVCCTRAIWNVGQACQVHFCMNQSVLFPRGWVRTSSPPLPLPGHDQPPAVIPAGRWLLRSALGLREGSFVPRVRKRVGSSAPPSCNGWVLAASGLWGWPAASKCKAGGTVHWRWVEVAHWYWVHGSQFGTGCKHHVHGGKGEGPWQETLPKAWAWAKIVTPYGLQRFLGVGQDVAGERASPQPRCCYQGQTGSWRRKGQGWARSGTPGRQLCFGQTWWEQAQRLGEQSRKEATISNGIMYRVWDLPLVTVTGSLGFCHTLEGTRKSTIMPGGQEILC